MDYRFFYLYAAESNPGNGDPERAGFERAVIEMGGEADRILRRADYTNPEIVALREKYRA